MRSMLLRVVLAGLFAFPLAGHAGLIGQEFTASYRFPNVNTVYASASFSPSTFAVGAGQESVGDVEGVTSLLVDFSDDVLTITLNTILTSPTWNSVAFNGPVFVATLPHGVTSAMVDGAATTMVGFDDSRVGFDAVGIFVNWQGLSYTNGTVVRVDFEFASVPEPATLALLCLALAGLAATRRRKQ